MNVMSRAADLTRPEQDLCSRSAWGELRRPDGANEDVVWQLPDETPIALQINSEPYAVMMATPSDLSDFATGFMIGEGLIADARKIQGILVMPVDNGVAVDVAITPDAIDASRLVRRRVEGRSGCGLCGVEDIAAAIRPLTPVARTWSPDTSAILKAAKALPEAQPMNAHNRTVHGAAWVGADGDIIVVREDVGRHNALDKLIGALTHSGADMSSGFVLMTSRCSFELVQKSVTAGIIALVTVSAPTALAFDLARRSNLFLAALGPGGVVVFNR